MYELRYSPQALKALEKLDNKTRERIVCALEHLRIRPTSCDIRKLVGCEGYRLRVGDYRILFDIRENILAILVLKIGHRKNIY